MSQETIQKEGLDPFTKSMEKFYGYGTIFVSLLTVALIIVAVGDKIEASNLKIVGAVIVTAVISSVVTLFLGNVKK
jgi:hypothetical protein